MAKITPKEPQVIKVINTVTPSFALKTIENWKQARRAFEDKYNPTRRKLYELYDDIMDDGQVEATWGKRRDHILNRRLVFVKDGVEDETINALLNSPDMRHILEEIHKTIAYGYTLLQFININYDEGQECYRINFDLIPRECVHPEEGFECISKKPDMVQPDFMYMQPPLADTMLWCGDAKSKGLMFKVAPYIIYKRGAMGDWSQFSEMFGMPFREAIYEAFDDDTRRKVEDIINNWGAGMSAVHPKSVEFKLHDTGGSTSSADVYDKFVKICDAGVSKTILGNTLTTEAGDKGARSLGEVHENEEDDKKKSDELFVLSVLNTQFRAILKKFGIDASGGQFWYETPDKDWENLKIKWDVINSISDKVPLDDDFIYTEFDLPKPENYEALKEDLLTKRAVQGAFTAQATTGGGQITAQSGGNFGFLEDYNPFV
ncbi:MAG: DUF935 domain-containing protein [Prevotellaceae bacterium]|jgi:hypothetical protein|nr:DUF935 domain-containing protein [Prevotellaceae bacterium]